MRMLLPVTASACRVVFGDAYASGIQDVEVTKSWPEWMPLQGLSRLSIALSSSSGLHSLTCASPMLISDL